MEAIKSEPGVEEFQDEIYRLNNVDNIYVKSTAVFLPTLLKKKQGIILIHHLKNIDNWINVIKSQFPEMKIEKYHNELEMQDRDVMRETFNEGLIQFLFATPNMIEWNVFFEDFLHNQIVNKNITIAVEFRNRDYPGYNPVLAELKGNFPNQKWILFTDYDDEKFEDLKHDIPLQKVKIIDLRNV
uniref:CSON002979 protein n=1 Tax=Culicoides sonorensis TaxID=179676 RepID=A0A336MLP2_CULSO